MDRLPDTLSIEIVVQSPLWEAQPAAETVLRRAVQVAASELSTAAADIAIVLTDDSAIRALNRDWRGHDRPTNVLSFPAPRRGKLRHAEASAAPTVHLGDIVIAFETTMQEALSEGKGFEDHLTHLVVHGFLHLLGQDHDNDSEAEAMEGLERGILARLGIPDPYVARDLVPTAGSHA